MSYRAVLQSAVVLHAASLHHRQNWISLVSYQQLPYAKSVTDLDQDHFPPLPLLSSCMDSIFHFKSTHHDHHDVAPCADELLELKIGWDGSLHEFILPRGRQPSR